MFGPCGSIRIIGHRGARGVAPENTIPAIRHGTEVGAEAIEIAPGDLRLFNLRERYHLPNYKAHNALSDAISTAELFLALAAESGDLAKHRLQAFLD